MKPNKATITNVNITNTDAIVSWIPGGDGTNVHTFELWYRDVLEDEFHWKIIKDLSSSTRSHIVKDLNSKTQYYFSVRGINGEGPGPFSEVRQGGSGDIPSIAGPLDRQGTYILTVTMVLYRVDAQAAHLG